MKAYQFIPLTVLASLLICQSVVAKETRTARYYETSDFLFFQQPASGGDVVRFVPHAATTVKFLYVATTSGGEKAKIWRAQVSLDFEGVDAAKVEARAANPAWSSLPFVRDAVSTSGCRFLLSDPDVKVVTAPQQGPYAVLVDRLCVLEVATRSTAAETKLAQLAAAGKLVDTGVEPYRVIETVRARVSLGEPHHKLAQVEEKLQGVEHGFALFMTGYSVAAELNNDILSLPQKDLEPIFNSLLDAAFVKQSDFYSLRESPTVPFIDVEKEHVVTEFRL